MQSSSSPQNTGNSPTKEGVPSQEQVRKRTTGFSRESLRNNLEEIAKEAEEIKQELPEEQKKVDTTAIKREIEELDKKYVWWLWLYRCWLIYNIWEHSQLRALMASEEIIEAMGESYMMYVLVSIVTMMILTAQYSVQLLAMFRRSLKLNNIAIKIMVLFGLFGLIKAGLLLFTLSDYDIIKKLSDEIASQMIVTGVLESPFQYLSKDQYQWIVLKEVGEFVLDVVLTYGGARLYRRYLTKRESMLKQKTE